MKVLKVNEYGYALTFHSLLVDTSTRFSNPTSVSHTECMCISSSVSSYVSVIRAKISGEKIVSPSNSSSPYMKMIQYEIKMIKVGCPTSSEAPLYRLWNPDWRGVEVLLLFYVQIDHTHTHTHTHKHTHKHARAHTACTHTCEVLTTRWLNGFLCCRSDVQGLWQGQGHPVCLHTRLLLTVWSQTGLQQ